MFDGSKYFKETAEWLAVAIDATTDNVIEQSPSEWAETARNPSRPRTWSSVRCVTITSPPAPPSTADAPIAPIPDDRRAG